MSAEQEEGVAPRQVGLWVEVTDEARGTMVLKLGASRFECILVPDEPDYSAGGQRGPAHTLDRWLTELGRLGAGSDRVMLPFNFSDQCTGWLRVTPSRDGLVEVQAGWSYLGQYDFDTSDVMAVGRSLSDFEPVPNARIERPLVDIVGAVRASRDDLARRFPPGATGR